jgi:hypothetical protein
MPKKIYFYKETFAKKPRADFSPSATLWWTEVPTSATASRFFTLSYALVD